MGCKPDGFVLSTKNVVKQAINTSTVNYRPMSSAIIPNKPFIGGTTWGQIIPWIASFNLMTSHVRRPGANPAAWMS